MSTINNQMKNEKTQKSVKSHVWHYSKKSKITACKNCGLIPLKNEATARAIRQPCPDNIWPFDL